MSHLYNLYKTRNQLLISVYLTIILYLFSVTHRPNQAGHIVCHSNKIFHSFIQCLCMILYFVSFNLHSNNKGVCFAEVILSFVVTLFA